jgi:hypothetical protein
MALKLKLTEEERYGLNAQEIILAEKYLRKHKTFGALKDAQAFPLWEMYLIGHTFSDIHKAFPEYEMGQILLTASLRGWPKDKERINYTLQDRVRSRVIRTVLGSVDFLTTMMDVTAVEHLEAMRKYIQDPVNNPKPELRAESIKDYRDISEALFKIVNGVNNKGSNAKDVSVYALLNGQQEPAALPEKKAAPEKKKAISLEDIETDE